MWPIESAAFGVSCFVVDIFSSHVLKGCLTGTQPWVSHIQYSSTHMPSTYLSYNAVIMATDNMDHRGLRYKHYSLVKMFHSSGYNHPNNVIQTKHRRSRWSSGSNDCITVYPKKYAHGFVVLCFVVVMQSFIMNSHEVFIHIHQGCFAGTGAIVRLPQCQWSKPDGYGKISQCITTTKHSKAKTVCIFLGIYCMWANTIHDNTMAHKRVTGG